MPSDGWRRKTSIEADPEIRMTLPRAFAVIALVFGTTLVLVVPPFQSPDESFHFLRAYQITEGDFVATRTGPQGFKGAILPISLDTVAQPFLKMCFHPQVKASVREILRVLRVPLDPRNRAFQIFPNTAHYCPTCYVGQCLGIGLGRVAGAGPLAMMYLGREGNLLVWIVLGFFALRCAPAIARPLFLLLLMPMSINFAATLSADPSTNGLAALFTALICRYFALGAGSITRKRIALLAVISVPLTVSKLAYAPLLALLLLIPARNFGTRPAWAAKLALLAALNLTAFTVWAASSSNLDTQINPGGNTSATAQLHIIQQNPTHFANVLLATIRRGWWYWLGMFVGIVGWFDQYLPAPFVIAYLILLVLACWPWDQQPPLPSPLRAAMIVIPLFIAVFLVIALLSYLFWTQLNEPLIYGINGRYFIPVAPAILLLLCSSLRRLPVKWPMPAAPLKPNAVATLISLGVCSYFLATVWSRYYG
jgi:uncharacterized membrane protein